MLPIQVRGRRQRDEELRAVRVRTGVRHGEDARAGVLQLVLDLVREFRPVDRRSSAA